MNSTEALARLLATSEPPLATCLLHLSASLSGRDDAVEVGSRLLDEAASGIETRSIEGLVGHLFDSHGFRGDVEDYHSPENSFLDRVLERRVGMPITLSAVVADVGARIGITLHLVGMPGHVLVGLPGDGGRYIDAFSGTELNEDGVRQRFESIFGADATLAPRALQPIDTLAVVQRVCNNLMQTWLDRDRASLNRLLDVRAALPGSPRDRQMLIGMAEARGRFDLAARLRSDLDPDDPAIDKLWARLN